MYEAFWEAIRVERLIKRYRLQKVKMQEEKSLQTIEAHAVEPTVENVKADIEVQDKEKGKVTATFEETSGNPYGSETSELMHNSELPSLSSVDQQVKQKRKARALENWKWSACHVNIQWIWSSYHFQKNQ